MKTLLLALISPGKSKGTREGAIRGLVGVGKEAVRKGLIEGGGAKVVGSECQDGEGSGALIESVMVRTSPVLYSCIRDSYHILAGCSKGFTTSFRHVVLPGCK